MAYILGFFAADGYITHNKRGAYFWCIQITDKDILEKIKKIIQAEHKISSRIPKRKTEKTLYRLQIGSKEMCHDLYKLGFKERKTKNLALPNVPKKYLPDFSRGYFDGDGNVWVGFRSTKRVRPTPVINTVFTSCSKEFLEELESGFLNAGIPQGALRKGTGNYYRLVYSINGSLKLYDFMYNGCIEDSLFLSRKKRIFEKFKSMRL